MTKPFKKAIINRTTGAECLKGRNVAMSDRPKRILIVDDSETFLMYISIILRRMGFDKVIPASNGIEALKLLGILMPDVVMLDITMPQMDGITALRHIRGNERTSNIPVIMVTTASDNKTYEECERFGCCGYLTKPVNITELNNALNECIFYAGGKKRQFLRTSFEKKVAVTHNGVEKEHYAVSLSEGGMYIRNINPLSIGTEVEIALPLKDKKTVSLKGTVIYVKGLH
ncbi:MAG: response regulator, partial [Nitrospirota bacterium]|nr:response regulator [Nitrospirota bacterium]